jgi:hypothetical protein
MSQSQRTKGAGGEREAAIALRPVFPHARRKVVNHAAAEDGVDLVETGAFRVQVKRHKKLSPITAINEIQDTTGIPLLLTRADGGEWFAAMRLADLLKILQDIGEAYE